MLNSPVVVSVPQVEELKRQLSEKTDELNAVLGTSREEMWDRDLIHLRDQIQAEWTKQEKEEDEARKVRANKKKQAEVKERIVCSCFRCYCLRLIVAGHFWLVLLYSLSSVLLASLPLSLSLSLIFSKPNLPQ